jgi:hypothetical protein
MVCHFIEFNISVRDLDEKPYWVFKPDVQAPDAGGLDNHRIV